MGDPIHDTKNPVSFEDMEAAQNQEEASTEEAEVEDAKSTEE